MSVFEDKKLTQLDWMSQMTETIESDLNLMLIKLPDHIVLTAQDIIDYSGNYLSLSVRHVISSYLRELCGGMEHPLSWEEHNLLEQCFIFELKGQPEIDLRTPTLFGEIRVVKIKQTFSDEELQPLMGQRGYQLIGRASDHSHSNSNIERMNEILDMLGGNDCKEAMKNRSGKKKIIAIKARLEQIFITNEWRIRDMNLSNKVGYWIKSYLDDGNLAALTNLCKLKVMTHNNMPIYSVKEEI